MQLIDEILVNNFSIWQLQYVKGDPIVPRCVTIKQIGLHPGRITRILDEKMTKIWMLTYPLVHQKPITATRTKRESLQCQCQN
jgi:hypothetical protein